MSVLLEMLFTSGFKYYLLALPVLVLPFIFLLAGWVVERTGQRGAFNRLVHQVWVAYGQFVIVCVAASVVLFSFEEANVKVQLAGVFSGGGLSLLWMVFSRLKPLVADLLALRRPRHIVGPGESVLSLPEVQEALRNPEPPPIPRRKREPEWHTDPVPEEFGGR